MLSNATYTSLFKRRAPQAAANVERNSVFLFSILSVTSKPISENDSNFQGVLISKGYYGRTDEKLHVAESHKFG